MWPWPSPFQGRFFIGMVGLAMINLYAKFEACRCTHYEAKNGSAECRKWGGLGWLRSWAMSPFDRVHTTSYSTLIETMQLSCIVFKTQQAIRWISPILTYPPAFATPTGGDIFSIRKLHIPQAIVWFCLHDPMFSCFSRTSTCDRQTETLSGITRLSRYQKGKTNLDFTDARDSEWQWHQLGHMQVCTVLQRDNNASTTPLSFLQAGCRSCRPTNSVKALKATVTSAE